MEAALGLKDLIWVGTGKHRPIGSFKVCIARSDVSLVRLSIRWSSHSFGDVERFCKDYGKPLVRLTCGLNPNQVAAQILAQGSRHLDALHALPPNADATDDRPETS